MQDTAQEVVSSKSTSSNADKLARALGSTTFQAAARRGGNEDSSTPPVGLFGSGNGTVLKLLQRGKKGKDAVKSIVVPETAQIAQKNAVDTEADRQRALEKAQNKAFILDFQEKELSGNLHLNSFGPHAQNSFLPKHLLPGQSASSAASASGASDTEANEHMKRNQEKIGLKINSRAAGLNSALQEARSWNQHSRVQFARRGFGFNGGGAHKN